LGRPAGMLRRARGLQLPVLVRKAVVRPAAAPPAISVRLRAEASGRDGEQAASLVLWSTLIGLVSVPLWWMLLSRLGPA
ncbi:MAG: permease, partial [Cyanobacteriota bacterium]